MEPRIAPRTLSDYPWYLKLLFKLQSKKFGVVLTPSLLWGFTPLQSLIFTLFYVAITRRKCSIAPELRSLAMVRVAQVHGCHFCVDLNALILNKNTTNFDKYFQLAEYQKSSLFTEQEKAVLAYAEAMTQTECQVTDAIMNSLKLFLNPTQIVELTGIIAYQNMSARFNSALNIPPQGLCQLTPSPGK